MFRSVLFVTLAALVSAAPIFTQTAKRYVLTFDVTPAGALVSVDGVPIEGTTAGVTAGAHTIRVSRAGYTEYTASIDVRAPQVVSVQLRRQQLLVRFQVNVVGASIEVDGAVLTDDTVLLSPGVHGLRVTAPGWEEHLEVFTTSESMTVYVELSRSGPLLSVTANVKGAEVWIDDVFRGLSPLALNLPTDRYTLRVSAEGYEDYEAQLNFSRALTLNVQLKKSKTQPGFALLNIVIPDQYLDADHSVTEARALMRLYIDGKLADTRKDLEGIRVPSGRHQVRLVSGGLSVDLGELVFLPMVAYDIELSLGIRIRSARQ
jgi:hypothetical protein